MAEFKNTFSWSKSRDSMFKDCTRKYFYNYYGYWDGWKDFSDDEKKKLNYLKRLKTKEIWIGEKVHEVIEFVLKKYKIGEKISMSHALSIIRAKLDAEFNESLIKTYTGFHSKLKKLFEHEYDIRITKEDKQDLFDLAGRCIANFYNSDIFMEIRQAPVEDWILLEDFLKFDYEGTVVYLSIDFALRKGEKIILYDWKTGKERFADFDLQLSLYSMYVAHKFNINPENIIAKIYNVSIDKEDEFIINEQKVEEVKIYMEKSIEKMKDSLTNVEENVAEKKYFPQKEGFRCGRCNFKKVCLEGW